MNPLPTLLVCASLLTTGAASVSLPDPPIIPERADVPVTPSLALSRFQAIVRLPEIHDASANTRPTETKGRMKIGMHRPFNTAIRVDHVSCQKPEWTRLPDGSLLWAASISADRARGLRLHVQNVRLPKGSTMLVYAPGSGFPSSVISSEEVADINDIWMPSVPGELLIFECRVASQEHWKEVSFDLDAVSHLYESPTDIALKLGACLEDISCHPGWQREASGVGRMTFVEDGDTYLCTGALLEGLDPVNAARLFLTANHCVSSRNVAYTVEVHWLYQTTRCGGSAPAYPAPGQITSGADFLTGSPTSDFSLLRLRRSPPSGVFYLQWSVLVPQPGEALVSIHHPQGREKSICFGEQSRIGSNLTGVKWSQGVTQQGSSGSPLFNSQRQVIGQLYGGSSACSNPGGVDFFGRFDISYPIIRRFLDPQNVATNIPTVTVPPGTYSGLFSKSDALYRTNSGALSLVVSSQNAFSGTVRMHSGAHGFSGRFDPSGTAVVSVWRRSQPPLTGVLKLDPANSNLISGTIATTLWTADTYLNRSVYDGVTRIAPQAGRYTLLLESAETNVLPGYAVATISKAGYVRISGRLPGAGAWSGTGYISRDGEYPLFMQLLNNTQAIMGKTFFNAGLWAESSGNWNWFRSGGITNLNIEGWRFSTPLPDAPVLGSSNIVAVLSGSGLTNDLVFDMGIGNCRKGSAVAPSGQKLSLQFATNGVFTGGISRLAPSALVPVRGVVLQGRNTAVGYYSLGTRRGRITISGGLDAR